MTKKVIESVVLGVLLLLAIIVGPALSSANRGSQTAAAVRAGNVDIRGNDYSTLDPLSRDQLIAVIKCLTDGSGYGMAKCVAKVTPPATSTPATMTMAASDVQIRSMNYRISTNNGVERVPMISFNVDSYGGSGKIKTLPVGFNGDVFPTTVYLYDGNTLLASKTGGANVLFENINYTVPMNTIKTLTIRADYPSNTLNGQRSAVFVTPGTYEKVPGVVATMQGAAVDGRMQYFFYAAAQYRVASAPTITASMMGATSSPILTAAFPLTAQALGGTVQMPSSNGSDFVVVFTNGTNSYAATVKSVVTIPNQNIAEGSVANVTVTASANSSTILSSGLYNAKITSIKWNAGSGVVTQTYGLEDFKTVSAAQFNR